MHLTDAAHRKIAGYSKGMRQRIKLAQAIAHDPRVLILDEPLNGLDPLMRAEAIALFREVGGRGLHVISSHILHEVDMISDQVIMLSNGYVIAEGQIMGPQEIRAADANPDPVHAAAPWLRACSSRGRLTRCGSIRMAAACW